VITSSVKHSKNMRHWWRAYWQANVKLSSLVDALVAQIIEDLAAEYFHKVLRDDKKRHGSHVVSLPSQTRGGRESASTEEEKKDKLRKAQKGRIAIPGKFMIKTTALLNVMKTLKEQEEKGRDEKRRKDLEEDDEPPWQRRSSPSPPVDSHRFLVDSEEEAEEAEELEVNCGDEMYNENRC